MLHPPCPRLKLDSDYSISWMRLRILKFQRRSDYKNIMAVSYDRLHVYIPIKSKSSQYWNMLVLLPLGIIDITSMVAFTPVASGDSLTLLFTRLLSIIALKWSCAAIIPKITYNCTLDKLFIVSYFLIFSLMLHASFHRIDFVFSGICNNSCTNIFELLSLFLTEDDKVAIN